VILLGAKQIRRELCLLAGTGMGMWLANMPGVGGRYILHF